MIFDCGKFNNVPLIGIWGRVNYNPNLVVWQLGFALIGPPEDRRVKESLYYDVAHDIKSLKEVVQAWSRICVKTKEDLGKRDCIVYPNYMEWLTKKAEFNGLPFPLEDPLYGQVS